MEVLGIGPLEALFVLILALLVVGPQDLGKAARSFGRFLNQLYRSEAWSAITQASRNLRTLPNRLAREAALEELDEARSELHQASQGVGRELDRFGRELKGGPSSTSGLPGGAPDPGSDPPGPGAAAAESEPDSPADDPAPG
jgi:Sec-independent protein translocase protein TatA